MPFIAPVYVPEPYAFTGLSISSLPTLSQTFLATLNACASSPTLIPAARLTLAQDLAQRLFPIDASIIRRHHEALSVLNVKQFSEAQHEEYAKDDWKRVTELLTVLIPARERVVTDFVQKFDALVWLEGNIVANATSSATPEKDGKYRDTLLAPYLKYTEECLAAIEEAFTNLVGNPRSGDEHAVMGKLDEHMGGIKKQVGPVIESMIRKIMDIPSRAMFPAQCDA